MSVEKYESRKAYGWRYQPKEITSLADTVVISNHQYSIVENGVHGKISENTIELSYLNKFSLNGDGNDNHTEDQRQTFEDIDVLLTLDPTFVHYVRFYFLGDGRN